MRGASIAISWPSPRRCRRSDSSPAEELKEPKRAVSEAARRREGQKPCPDDALDHRPFEGARGLGEADTHDRRRYAVGGGYRHAEMRRDGKDGRRARLGGEAVDRMEL